MSCCCDPTETSAFGAITRYTVGPEWTGAQFATIQAAVDQAVADGHSGSTLGQTVQFTVYPGLYPDPVVIPATLPRWNLVGEGGGEAGVDPGVEITGTFAIALPATNSSFSIRSIGFTGAFSITQAAGAGTAVTGHIYFTVFNSTTNVNAPNTNFKIWSSSMLGTAIWTTNIITWRVGRLFGTGAVFTCGVNGSNQLYYLYVFPASLTVRGRSVGMQYCVLYYPGSLAVTDECTAFSEYSFNTFSRNAGPVGPPVRKTGASSLTDGGNTFVDGVTYPYFEVLGGTRPNRGKVDDQLREVISVAVPAGPVVSLTAAQVENMDLLVQVTAGGGVLALPPCTAVPRGARVTVKRMSGVAASFGIQGTGLNFVDGAASISILNALGCLTFQNDGVSNWNITASYLVP